MSKKSKEQRHYESIRTIYQMVLLLGVACCFCALNNVAKDTGQNIIIFIVWAIMVLFSGFRLVFMY